MENDADSQVIGAIPAGEHLLRVRAAKHADPAAPVVVVLPAMGVPARYYRPFVAELNQLGMHVVTFDFRGQGECAPRASRRVRYSYQTLLDAEIPSVDLSDGAGRVRVIAGRFDGHAGPARTHTPMDVWDIRLRQGHHAELPVADGRTLALVVLKGTVRINGGQPVGEAQLVTFDRSGEDVFVDADSDATVLLLSGEPIDEPVVGYGPFVMNSQAEIAQAVNDFNSGRFGQIAH